MTKRISILSAVALLAVVGLPVLSSAEVADAYKAVVHDARGNPVTDARGNCVRTNWNVANEECGVVMLRAHTKLASVYFDFNKATLTKKSRATLNELLRTLRDKRVEAVTLAGFADAVGTDSYNQRLSEKRARTVKAYLDAHGFTNSNTVVRALGERATVRTGVCNGLKGEKLHACMQEDRRVDVEVAATGGAR